MKELHKFLKVFIFVQLGSCCGRVLAQYLDYVNHPQFYAMQSAPWYYRVMISVLFTLVTVAVTTAAYFIIGHFIKKQEEKK